MNHSAPAFSLDPYLRLARLNRPVGSLLLLWPTLAALWAAATGMPPLALIIVFTLGTFLMRSAGCVINDIADRSFDKAVQRTRGRPLATGEIPLQNAWVFFAILAGLAGMLLFFVNPFTRWLALAGLAIAMLYPLMKRITHMPQLVLGAAFSWGIIMAYGALHERVPSEGWLIFVASLFWIVAYDTLYAMVDREDDLRIGVKSTAILFGSADRVIIGVLQGCTLVTLVLWGQRNEFGLIYALALMGAAALFIYQQWLIQRRQRDACMKAFGNNIWVGFVLFAGVVGEVMMAQWLV